jgi:hypothetical protein
LLGYRLGAREFLLDTDICLLFGDVGHVERLQNVAWSMTVGSRGSRGRQSAGHAEPYILGEPKGLLDRLRLVFLFIGSRSSFRHRASPPGAFWGTGVDGGPPQFLPTVDSHFRSVRSLRVDLRGLAWAVTRGRLKILGEPAMRSTNQEPAGNLPPQGPTRPSVEVRHPFFVPTTTAVYPERYIATVPFVYLESANHLMLYVVCHT